MSSKPPRTIYILASRPDSPVDMDLEWGEKHMARTRCPQCNGWRSDIPLQPIHAVVLKSPKSIITTTGLFAVIYTPLAESLLPYNKHIEIGTVRVARGRVLSDWVTINYPPNRWLEVNRGRYSRHDQCPGCGRLRNRVGWAHPAIVERYLSDAWLFLDKYGDIYADSRLVEKETLRERFPTLRCYPIPIVPEPLDGQTLPGDKGWKGILRKRPSPKPPKHKPEQGIGLWL